MDCEPRLAREVDLQRAVGERVSVVAGEVAAVERARPGREPVARREIRDRAVLDSVVNPENSSYAMSFTCTSPISVGPGEPFAKRSMLISNERTGKRISPSPGPPQ